MQCQLTPSDVIEICGIIASLITSIAAIVISVKTLRQNSKMIEESTRPNIQIYPVYMNSILYIVIKNYGASEAYIDQIDCNHQFSPNETMGDKLGADIFSRVKGAILSPGYAIKCPLIAHEITDDDFCFHLLYHSAEKSYETEFHFNVSANAPFADLYPTSHSTDGHLQNISRELRDIVKTRL